MPSIETSAPAPIGSPPPPLGSSAGTVAEQFIDFAVERNLLDGSAADRARGALRRSGQSVDTVLSELGLLSEAGLVAAQSAFLDLPVARREEFPAEPVAVDGLSPDFLRGAGLLPLAFENDELLLATARPLETEAIRSVSFCLDKAVRLRVAGRSEIEAALKALYGDGSPERSSSGDGIAEGAEDDL